MKACELDEDYDESKLERKILREMRERVVRSLLDVIVLVKLQKEAATLGGYDLMELVNEEFGVLMSAGTVYAFLYSMERDGLIEAKVTKSKRLYMLTEKGETKIKTISELSSNILDLVTKIVT